MSAYLNDPFLRGYLVAALWTGTDESDDSGGRPLDERFSVSDFSLESIQRAHEECAAFQMANLADLDQHPTSPDGNSALEYAGHNFWLSRCGHGCGFFDTNGLPEDAQKRLQDASRAAGERWVYIGDDGGLYIS